MNEAEGLAAFKETLSKLVGSVERSMKPGAEDAFIKERDGTIKVQEATTREKFLDDLLDALGWSRGLGGDLGVEVRLRGDTTVFVDYLGTARFLEAAQATPSPLLLVEAKAWGKPYIGARTKGTALPIEELLRTGIAHASSGGKAAKSPLRADWHDHLDQLSIYVRRLAGLGHKLRRVILTSGDWLLILDDAHEAFLGAGLGDDQFGLLRLEDYVRRSDHIYRKLSKAYLGREMPDWATVARAPTYIPADQISGVFLAAQVVHVQHGSGRVGPTPVLSVVPHVVLIDRSGRQLAVFANEQQSVELTGRTLADHLAQTRAMSRTVLDACSDRYGVALTPSGLPTYPGLPRDWRTELPADRFVAAVQTQPAEWTVITGDDGHFLLDQPIVANCAFHRWDAARGVGQPAGSGSINMPSVTGPRTLFVDGQSHHCAHAGLLEARKERCRIQPFEQRLCCQACRFLDSCWPAAERAGLPCGSMLEMPPALTEADDF